MLSGNVSGTYNVSVGANSAEDLTSGANNSFLGRRSGKEVTTGSNNTILGENSGNTTTTGSNNIIIGHDAVASSATVDNEITLGDTNITKFRIPAVSFEITANAVTQGGVFYENAQTVTSDYTITNGCNAMAAGAITIASGNTVTIGADETLTIV